MVVTPPASAAGRVVHPGESIQAAIDAARPGDTIRVAPGTYHESITIATDGITVVGSGPDKTHLRPPAEANDPCAAEGSGVCIFGQFDEDFNLIRPVDGVRLSNLSVSGFARVDQTGEPVGVGVFVLGGRDTTIDHVVTADNGVFGFTSILSSGDRYRNDTAHDNGFAGFQIAGEHGAAPVTAGRGYRLQHVVAYDNRFGIIVHAASGGVIVGADLHDNCLGAMFSGPDTSDWEMKRTTAHNNNRVCDALPGGDPAISGAGVAILGADHITIRLNTLTANRPVAESAFAGGIIVGSTPTPSGDRPSNNITVTKNEAEDNTPADIVWDGTGTAISFTRNDCDTSTPGGLCS
ncbi:MAG: right-handed parallel beta-helix repeat-containing protein [Acidimicrobiia bacterium]